MLINPYSTNVPFLDPLKTSENLYGKKIRNKNFPNICMFTMREKQITYSDLHHISILLLLSYIGTPLLSKKEYRIRNGNFFLSNSLPMPSQKDFPLYIII